MLQADRHVARMLIAGLPDTRLGQVPVAAVELRDDCSVGPDELREHCRKSLTGYEVPAEVYIVDALPRGAALKVDRRRLIEMVEQRRSTVAQAER